MNNFKRLLVEGLSSNSLMYILDEMTLNRKKLKISEQEVDWMHELYKILYKGGKIDVKDEKKVIMMWNKSGLAD